MVFNNKQTLYEYLNNFNFDCYRETELSSVYFLVLHSGKTEPIYFVKYDDVWFASPCSLQSFKMAKEDILNFVDSIYEPDGIEEALKFETLMHRDNYHYSINSPQCAPFLPEKVEILKVLTESECLDFLISNKTK